MNRLVRFTLLVSSGVVGCAGSQHPPESAGTAYIAVLPRVLREVKADFPEGANDRCGRVGMLVRIDTSGVVRDVVVVQKAGHGFDEAAAEAVSRMAFEPGRMADGRAVPCRIKYTYVFAGVKCRPAVP